MAKEYKMPDLVALLEASFFSALVVSFEAAPLDRKIIGVKVPPSTLETRGPYKNFFLFSDLSKICSAVWLK